MRVAGPARTESIWLGAMLLLLVVLLAFTSYHSTVVPQQTEQVEFQHARSVQTHCYRFVAEGEAGNTRTCPTSSVR